MFKQADQLQSACVFYAAAAAETCAARRRICAAGNMLHLAARFNMLLTAGNIESIAPGCGFNMLLTAGNMLHLATYC